MKVLPMAQVAIFKEIADQVRKDLDCTIMIWTKTSQRLAHYIYYLATDNIHIVLENDNRVNKRTVKVVNVKFSRNTHLIETSHDIEIKRNSHIFQAIQGNLC